MNLLYTILYALFIGQAFFFIGLVLPRSKFCEDKFPYKLYAWEKNGKFYNRYRIKKWKEKVPDMSKLSRKLYTKKIHKLTPDSIDRLVKESCVAEFVHYLLSISSLGIYEIWNNVTGIYLTIIYILGNIPFIMIQRYNRPNLIALREKLKLRKESQLRAPSND